MVGVFWIELGMEVCEGRVHRPLKETLSDLRGLKW